MPETIVVSPEPALLRLKPGEKATANVAIRNRSEEVEHYQLVVEGVPAGWAEIVPDQASAFPFQETNAHLNLHPPQGAVSATYHVLVRAVSQERAGMEGRGTVELEVPLTAPVAPPPPAVATTEPVVQASRTVAASQIQVKVEPVKEGALPPPAAQWRLLCKNAGVVLDTFSFGISGLRPNWLSIEPAEVTLKPGEEATAVLTIRPPQGTNAGVYAFVVRTFSHLNVNQRTEVPLKIEVRPSAGFRVGIFPKDAEAQGPREFKVSLTGDQASNCDLNIDLAATDTRQFLRFRL